MRSSLARSFLACALLLGAGAGVAGFMQAEEHAAVATVTQDPAKVEVWVTSTGKRYHTATCRYAQTKSNLKDAVVAGLTPCKVCHPPEIEAAK